MQKEEGRIRESLKRSEVIFNEEEHKYWNGDKELVGITSTLLRYAFPDTYKCPDNLSEEQWSKKLHEAAKKGTAVHKEIQDFCERGTTPTLPEVNSWVEAEIEHNINWIENEYLVTDNTTFASQIDILANVNGELSIIDIKRTQTIHYNEVALQTSIYKMFFENMNPSLEVKHCYVFWARDTNWKLIELPVVGSLAIRKLIDAYLSNSSSYKYEVVSPSCSKVWLRKLEGLMYKKKEIEDKIEILKADIFEALEKDKIKKLSYGRLNLECMPSSKTVTFDKTRFEKENPELADKYKKEGNRKGFIKISIKDE